MVQNDMMDHMMGGMITMGVIGILLVILLILGIAALIKYLSGGKRRNSSKRHE